MLPIGQAATQSDILTRTGRPSPTSTPRNRPDAVSPGALHPDHDRVAAAIEAVISRYGLGMFRATAGDFHDQIVIPSTADHSHACVTIDARRGCFRHGAGRQYTGLRSHCRLARPK